MAADIEVIAALAPKATVIVYESNQPGTGLGPWELAVSGTAAGGLPEVITSSWGSCEPDTGMGSSYYQAEESIFDEAAAQGQTIFVASGDDGSEGCLDQTRSKMLAVDDPATAPGVTAVGGTASDTPNGPQYVWNSRASDGLGCLGTGCAGDGASGGGAEHGIGPPELSACKPRAVAGMQTGLAGLPRDTGRVRSCGRPLLAVLLLERLRRRAGLGGLRRHEPGRAFVGRGGDPVGPVLFQQARLPQPSPL